VLSFNDRSLANTGEARWAVKKDGGDFDQFTGATVTPRALVRSVRNALTYFERYRDRLFAEPATAPAP
jgi:electron transport complex protein RnfG